MHTFRILGLSLLLLLGSGIAEAADGLYSSSSTQQASKTTKQAKISLDDFGEAGATISTGLDSLNDITSGLGDIGDFLDGVSNIGDFIDGILGNFSNFSNGIDDIFNSFNLGNIGDLIDGDNKLLGCLGANLDLSSLTGGGLCGLLNLKDKFSGFGLSGGLLGCLLGGADLTPDVLNGLDKLCNNPVGRGQATYDEDTGTWNPSGGYENTGEGGTIDSSSFTDLSSGLASSSRGGGFGGLTVDKNEDNNSYKYPNGKTPKEVYKDEGGAIAREVRANPSGSTAKAWTTNDTDTLIMKDYMARLNKTSDSAKLVSEATFTLPPTRGDMMDEDDAQAQLIGNVGYPALYELQKSLIKSVREKYVADSSLQGMTTLSEYYKKEKEICSAFIKNNETIKAIRLKAYKGIESYYALKLERLKKNKGYIPDNSELKAKSLPPKYRNRFRRMAIMQSLEETKIKAEMVMAKRDIKERIDRIIDRVYPASSVFNGAVAKKEIDEMLKAVDAIIH